MLRLTEKAHQILQAHLRTGDIAIDATAGQGFDTLMLCKWVGSNGRVYAIDLQTEALNRTRARLKQISDPANYTLIEACHAAALSSLEEPLSGQVAAIVFNLGYLPGSDKTVITQTPTTLAALQSSSTLLQAGGLLCVTAYRGHSGGLVEADQVANWMRTQAQKGWTVKFHEPPHSTSKVPPILWTAKNA